MDRYEYRIQNEKRDTKRQQRISWNEFWKWRPVWWGSPAEKFGFFVAAFTGALVLVAYWQLSAMQGQLSEMRAQTATTRTQIRANLLLDRMQVAVYSTNGAAVAGWELTPIWKNSGVTEARNVEQWWSVTVLDRPMVPSAALQCRPPQRPADARPKTIQAGQVFAQFGRKITIDELQKAMKNQIVIIVQEHVGYSDIFPDDPRTIIDSCSRLIPNDIPNGRGSLIDLDVLTH
jgi:hypothetical protein